MKRNSPSDWEPADWEEINDPEQTPRNLEDDPLEEELPTGERYDEDQPWRRPEGGRYRSQMDPSQSEMRSSERLYHKASQAKTDRGSTEAHANEFLRRSSRKRVISQTVVTLLLLVVIGLLSWGIKTQLDLRVEIQGRPTLPSVSGGGTPLTSSQTDSTSSEESGETTPLASVSVEIIGSWADRTPETTPEIVPETSPAEATTVN